MMREIIFRGKQKATGMWLCGDLRQWSEKRKGICDYALRRTLDVYPETVGQFTGLTDKNGKQIFEGDIVDPVLIDGTHIGFSWGRQVVVFDNGAFCLKDRRDQCTPMCNYSSRVEFEVLGNIHDNPELLENP